jgi:hypothetical protein
MLLLSPFSDSVTTTVLVLGVVLVLAVASYLAFQFRTFSGYREIASDVRLLSRTLSRSRIRRVTDDLVVTGTLSTLPVTICFSHQGDKPGVRLQVGAATNLQLSVYPQAAGAGPGRTVLITGVASIDNRFGLRTDNRTVTTMFLNMDGCLPAIAELCCSRQVRLEIQRGEIEFAEMLIPKDPARHVGAHIQSMVRLAGIATQMPGSDLVKIAQHPRPKGRLIAGLAFACLVLHFGVLSAVDRSGYQNGVAQAEAGPVIGEAYRGWHLAGEDGFDDTFSAWLASLGIPRMAHVVMLNERGNNLDAYLFVTTDGSKRVVIVNGATAIYDFRFLHLAGFVRIPREAISGTDWNNGGTAAKPDSDGVLLVREFENVNSAILLFVENGQLQSGTPADFKQLRFGASSD